MLTNETLRLIAYFTIRDRLDRTERYARAERQRAGRIREAEVRLCPRLNQNPSILPSPSNEWR